MTAIDAPASGASSVSQNATAGAQNQAPAVHDSGFSFHDILNIVNPLQHIPIVSTLYRAITGDTIKPFDKIAGDTLYGGVIGFVSSMADTVFQAVTGKDFGDTVLAFFTGSANAKPLAANIAPATGQAASTLAQSDKPALLPARTISTPGIGALWNSLTRNGVDPATAQRAAYAYQRAIGLTAQPPVPAVAVPTS